MVLGKKSFEQSNHVSIPGRLGNIQMQGAVGLAHRHVVISFTGKLKIELVLPHYFYIAFCASHSSPPGGDPHTQFHRFQELRRKGSVETRFV
jgi:hypothetical protein